MNLGNKVTDLDNKISQRQIKQAKEWKIMSITRLNLSELYQIAKPFCNYIAKSENYF
jgi:hypothetical protein